MTIPQRRSIRLPGYDYSSPGAYFLTLCTHRRELILGNVVDGAMSLSRLGEIVEKEWLRTSRIRTEVELDVSVVMPNHMHMIVLLAGSGESAATTRVTDRKPRQRLPRSLGALVAGFKSAATRRINEVRQSPGAPVWQRGYYERVVRTETELRRIQEYIVTNPATWSDDRYNPCTAVK